MPLPTGMVPTFWRFFVADLDGTGITDFSKIASNRVCEPILNGPLSLSGDAPSDNPLVNIPWTTDGYDDAYLAEGTRLMWGFRRESFTPPYYTVRAATLVNLVQDSARQDDATSSFTGWDPWHYLFDRPLINGTGEQPGPDGLTYTATQVSTIVQQLLTNTIVYNGHCYIDGGAGAGGTGFWAGTYETGAGMSITITFQQGISIGQAFQQLTELGVCDIVMAPIYDPRNRPNYLVDLSVYAEAGSIHDEFIFAWNVPGRSLIGLDRVLDGSVRANNVDFRAGQGGVEGNAPVQVDAASVAKYGEYWATQFFPGAIGDGAVAAVTSLAEQQLDLRANGRETVTFSPAPERSPRPWQDYNLGDRVPVWASATGFRQDLGVATTGTTTATQYQRIYGWRANISDEALETIDPMLTSPEGGFTG